jgi:hypothetical protein
LVFCSPIPSVTGNDGAKEEGEEGGEGTINVGEGACVPGGETRLLFGKEEQDSNGGRRCESRSDRALLLAWGGMWSCWLRPSQLL